MHQPDKIVTSSLLKLVDELNLPYFPEPPPISHYTRVYDINLHAIRWGNPKNPTILALHGFGQTAHSWDLIGLSLAKDYHFISLDQRGHGDSDWSKDKDYSNKAYLNDLKTYIEINQLKSIILMGLSMGGKNAYSYVALNPSVVKGLIIVDAAPETGDFGKQSIKRFLEQVDKPASFDDFVDSVKEYNPHRNIDQIRGSLINNLRQLTDGKWTWKYDKHLREHFGKTGNSKEADHWKYLKLIKCPTLIIRGENSQIVSQEIAETMLCHFKKGKLTTISDSGHLVPGDNPKAFHSAVTQFLSEIYK